MRKESITKIKVANYSTFCIFLIEFSRINSFTCAYNSTIKIYFIVKNEACMFHKFCKRIVFVIWLLSLIFYVLHVHVHYI